MTTLSTHARTTEEGRLQLDLETGLSSCDVEVVVVLHPRSTKKDPKQLLKLSRKLSWQGDPLDYQRRMRDEWTD